MALPIVTGITCPNCGRHDRIFSLEGISNEWKYKCTNCGYYIKDDETGEGQNVNKEQKIPVNFHDDQRDSWYECPVCHTACHKQCQKYCSNCGQRLGWDMEEMGRC